jgi:hypothetical protein
MSTPRRRFLGWLGSASLLSVTSRPSMAPLVRLDAAKAPPDVERPTAVSDKWDMSWTTRISGKYRAVFDSPEHSYGAALSRAVAWCEQYKEVYDAARTDMSPVVVLRHQGFMLALNDAYWGEYELGKELKMRDEKGRKWARTNPIATAPAGADADTLAFTLPAFIAAGGIVLACAWSFGGAVARVAKQDRIDRAAAEAKARSMLLPGIILQPNGIFAALRAQEAGCSYILAS